MMNNDFKMIDIIQEDTDGFGKLIQGKFVIIVEISSKEMSKRRCRKVKDIIIVGQDRRYKR